MKIVGSRTLSEKCHEVTCKCSASGVIIKKMRSENILKAFRKRWRLFCLLICNIYSGGTFRIISKYFLIKFWILIPDIQYHGMSIKNSLKMPWIQKSVISDRTFLEKAVEQLQPDKSRRKNFCIISSCHILHYPFCI